MASRTIDSPYQPLQQPRDSIRLLRVQSHSQYGVQCELRTFRMHELPAYIAGSYTWGDASRVRTIQLQGQAFEVRENLYEFLTHVVRFRGSEDAMERLSNTVSCREVDHTATKAGNHLQYRDPHWDMRHPSMWQYFWIDALCIDQSSLDERSAQVSIMAEIYKSATFVIAWLGDEAEDSNSAMQFMAKNYDFYRRLHPSLKLGREGPVLQNWERLQPDPPIDKAFDTTVPKAAIRSIFARPFWSRLWIIQEFILADDILFMCGDDTASVTALMEYMQFCDPPQQFPDADEDDYAEPPLLVLIDYRYHTDRSWSTLKDVNLLFEMLCGFKAWQCSEPKDRVFGMLGITSAKIKVDYNASSLQLYEDVLWDGVFEYLNDFDVEDPRWEEICMIMISAFGLDEEEALEIGKLILLEQHEEQEMGLGSALGAHYGHNLGQFEEQEMGGSPLSQGSSDRTPGELDDREKLYVISRRSAGRAGYTRNEHHVLGHVNDIDDPYLMLRGAAAQAGYTTDNEPNVVRRYELALGMLGNDDYDHDEDEAHDP